MAVIALLLGLIGTVLTARQVRFPLIMVVLGAEQLALHYFFASASTAAAIAGPVCGPGAVATTGHHATQLACTATTGTGMIMAGSTPWSMLITHLVATAATAWLLTRGEAWLWRQAERVVAMATAAPTIRFRSRRPVLIFTSATAAYALPRSAWSPRGPPRL